jgi:hypothetical protein
VRSFITSRLFFAWIVVAGLLAAPSPQTRQPFTRVAVTVTPDHQDWTYQPEEPVPSGSTWSGTAIKSQAPQ